MNYRHNHIGNNDVQYGTNENDSIGKYILVSNYHKLFINVAFAFMQLSIYYFLCQQKFKISLSTNVSFMTI